MKFEEASIPGVFVVELERASDERGYFARTFCQREFARHGLDSRLVQSSVSMNKKAGTLRGMHYSVEPFSEAKLVRCVRGAIYDVALDLRRDSPKYLRWFARRLDETNGDALYVPPGVAHGFQTLTDDAVVSYQMTEFYVADCARGVRWDDPVFGIDWPACESRTLSDRDANYPGYDR